jgi:hypothetical protein
MGTQGEDLLLSPQARKVWPYYTEVKNVESINIWKAILQATKGADKGLLPLVVFRKNNTRPFAAIPLEELIWLRQKAHGTQG